ncbi:MAG TPA: hypothetical protein VGO93_01920 [Candidatus Xenobia bacterium]|jgi:hypothetical protein
MLPPINGHSRTDMYHDVGMYRDKPFDDAVHILQDERILGRSAKGAQVTADARPTNWGSAATPTGTPPSGTGRPFP